MIYKCEMCEQEINESDIILGDTHTIEVGEGMNADIEHCGPVLPDDDELIDDDDDFEGDPDEEEE